jgi:hypothetical protein
LEFFSLGTNWLKKVELTLFSFSLNWKMTYNFIKEVELAKEKKD